MTKLFVLAVLPLVLVLQACGEDTPCTNVTQAGPQTDAPADVAGGSASLRLVPELECSSSTTVPPNCTFDLLGDLSCS